MNLRPLKTELKSGGFLFRQIERNGDVAIFEQTKEPGIRAFEVVRIRTAPPHPKDPRLDGADRVESYPSSEHWGRYGWTYTTEEDARKKFAALCEATEKKGA